MANTADLIITIAYFSIPIQILVSLWQYPRLSRMPPKIFLLFIFFALFIFLCGAGHLMRCLDQGETYLFTIINISTCVVSLITALYLLPLIPHLLGNLDEGLQTLVKLNAETVESNLKLVNFMAFLCHEIRNPLFAITSSVSFLSDTELTEEQRVGVGSIIDSSKLMMCLVNDVLELSKIDSGKLELEDRNFDLRHLLHNFNTNMRMQIRKKHGKDVDFRFSVSADVPRIVRGDSVRILQILYNLLSNSNKFTANGHIEVAVSVDKEEKLAPTGEGTAEVATCVSPPNPEHVIICSVKEQEEEDCRALLDAAEEGKSKLLTNDPNEAVVLSIVVSDTGVGISPERIQVIFEPYSQAKLSDYREHGGTGLGLSILSSILKIMGGSIAVWSEVGVGSRFALKLPLKVVPDGDFQNLDDTDADMKDQLNAFQRLSMYDLDDNRIQQGPSSTIDSLDAPPSNSSAGLSGSPQPKVSGAGTTGESCSGSAASQQCQLLPLVNTRNVVETKSSKKPKFPKFGLPPGDCVVLVVDDNCVNRKIIGRMLTLFGVEYEEAVNGREAVEAVRRSRDVTGDPSAPRFGLVFMDLSMPVMDGFEAIDMIRKEVDGAKHLPIVALTANALSQERKKALEVGANEFHTKPILREDLYAVCKRFLLPSQQEGKGKEGNIISQQIANGCQTSAVRVSNHCQAAASMA